MFLDFSNKMSRNRSEKVWICGKILKLCENYKVMSFPVENFWEEKIFIIC